MNRRMAGSDSTFLLFLLSAALCVLWGCGSGDTVTDNAPSASTAPSETQQSPAGETPQALSPETSTVSFTSLDAADWIASKTPAPLVKVIPTHCRVQNSADGLRFSNRREETIFRYRQILRGNFTIRYTVVFDSVPSEPAKFKWAAGSANAAKEQLLMTIPATTDMLDGKPHQFEFAHRETETTLTCNGQLYQTLSHVPERQPWPKQFFIYAFGDLKFRLTELHVTVDDIALDTDALPKANVAATGLRPRVFQPRPEVPGEIGVDVGGEIARATLAKRGELLVLHNRGLRQIQILDVVHRSLIKTIPADGELLIAAGKNVLVAFFQDQHRLVSWNLDSFEVQANRNVGQEFRPLHMALGAAADGPLLVVRHDPQIAAVAELLNPGDLQPVSVQWQQPEQRPLAWHEVKRIRSSSDGRVFGVLSQRDANRLNDPHSIVFDGRTARIYEVFELLRSDGECKFGPTRHWPHTRISSFGGQFELRLERANHQTNEFGAVDAVVSVAVPEMKEPLIQLSDLDLTHATSAGLGDHWGQDDLMDAERLYLIPSFKTIVTLPRTNRHVVFRDFDLTQQLAASDRPYLFFQQLPELRATRGSTFRRRLATESNQSIEARLIAHGQQKITMDGDLNIVWNVPHNAKSLEQFQIDVYDADSTNQVVLFRGLFFIRIQDPAKTRRWRARTRPASCAPGPMPRPSGP